MLTDTFVQWSREMRAIAEHFVALPFVNTVLHLHALARWAIPRRVALRAQHVWDALGRR
jgi:hypothetical protein